MLNSQSSALTSRQLRELQACLGAENVLTQPAQLMVYDSDGVTLEKLPPAAVVFVRSTQEVQALVRWCRHSRRCFNPEYGPDDMAVFYQLRHYLFYCVHRNSETDSGTRAAGTVNCCIDADELAERIQQRPARIARIYRGICLNRAANFSIVGRINFPF